MVLHGFASRSPKNIVFPSMSRNKEHRPNGAATFGGRHIGGGAEGGASVFFVSAHLLSILWQCPNKGGMRVILGKKSETCTNMFKTKHKRKYGLPYMGVFSGHREI